MRKKEKKRKRRGEKRREEKKSADAQVGEEPLLIHYATILWKRYGGDCIKNWSLFPLARKSLTHSFLVQMTFQDGDEVVLDVDG